MNNALSGEWLLPAMMYTYSKHSIIGGRVCHARGSQNWLIGAKQFEVSDVCDV